MPERFSRRKENTAMPFERIAISSVIGVSLFFLSVIAFSYVELKAALGEGMYMPVGLTAALASAFLSGFIAVIKDKQKAVPIGAATGGIQAAVIGIALAVINRGVVGKGLIFIIISFVAGSIIGGIVAANIKTKIKY